MCSATGDDEVSKLMHNMLSWVSSYMLCGDRLMILMQCKLLQDSEDCTALIATLRSAQELHVKPVCMIINCQR